MKSLTEFAHYVVAVQKRLTYHFGVSPYRARVFVDKNQGPLFKWYKNNTAADTAARILVDRSDLAKENPLPDSTMLWFGAVVAGAVGAYFVSKAVTSSVPSDQTVQPPPVTNTGSLNSIGPIGVTPSA